MPSVSRIQALASTMGDGEGGEDEGDEDVILLLSSVRLMLTAEAFILPPSSFPPTVTQSAIAV
ncbi:MAG: hypothetical protein HC866_19490 [Leptolyngbyaceae cyanobacterium RU_5_1]|nr:hypothetical protein [Leptolyngbyaceae cyanobacterium RU_5_1]